MKRKLALLLAGVMTLTMLPMNLFAATNNTLTRTAQVVPKGTVFMEENMTDYTKDVTGAPATAGALTGDFGGDVKQKVTGAQLKMELKNGVSKYEMVELRLTNGRWFFRADSNAKDASGVAINNNTTIGNAVSAISSDSNLYPNEAAGSFTTESVNDIDFSATGMTEATTYDVTKGTWIVKSKGNTGGYYVRNTGRADEVDYILKVSEVDDRVAYLTVLEDVPSNVSQPSIMVPLVTLGTVEDAEVSVSIQNAAGTSITQETKVIGIGGAGATNTYSKDATVVGRGTFYLDPVIINEVRIGSIGTGGEFELVAPNGFKFVNPTVGTTAQPAAKVSVDPGLALASGVVPTVRWKYDSGDIKEVVRVVIPAGSLSRSTNLAGKIYVSNLALEADDDAPWGDVNLSIKNISNSGAGDLKITDQTFKVAERKDWTVSLTAKDTTVKELVAGRYVTRNDSNYDAYHKASRVIFKEESLHAWWAERETKFVLPTGVKFRQVDIKEVKKMEASTAPAKQSYYVEVGSYTRVKLNEDSLVFKDMKIEKDEKATIEFDSWISISADYPNGDIPLKVEGSAVPGEIPAAIIAKSIAPIKVTTKSTDIKIGYQYQTTSDIEITENFAGALLKNKRMNLDVTDLVSTDVAFSPNIAINVTDGDLKLKDKSTSTFKGYAGVGNVTQGALGDGTGNISFAIDRASSKASTIKISNVSVKIDRGVPESNDRPYKVVVWGTAVAENYGDKNADKAYFDVPGVMADYLSVISAANDRTNVLTTEVRVTIGESTYSVNGEVFDMPAAAYISPKSNSTMVPLRFVANAFGIKDTQIVWDEVLRTVTLTDPSGKLIQFTVGKSEMVINGVKVPLLSPDGKQVSAEITDERTYIPFRAIGTAFGVDVAWDADTNTAIYNPGAAKSNNGAVQTAETATNSAK